MPVTSRTYAVQPSTIGAVILRDGSTCAYCMRRLAFTRAELAESGAWRGLFDHVIARELGGLGNASNVVCCCYTCNLIKGSGPVPEAARAEVQRRLAEPIDREAGRELARTIYPWVDARLAAKREANKRRRARLREEARHLGGTSFPFGHLARAS